MRDLTIDVEDYYSIVVRDRLGLEVTVSHHVDEEVARLLDFVDSLQMKATCFIVGRVAQERPHIVRDIAARGHEIASHSYEHLLMSQLTPAGFAEDLRRSVTVLEDITGQPVKGFRAPAFSLREGQKWAFEIMAAQGLEYDSSVRLVWPIGGGSGKSLIAHAATAGIREYAGIALGFGRLSVPLAGGGGIRLVPDWITRLGVKLVQRSGISIPIYIHPYDLAVEPDYDWPEAHFLKRARLAWFHSVQRRGRSKVKTRLSRATRSRGLQGVAPSSSPGSR